MTANSERRPTATRGRGRGGRQGADATARVAKLRELHRRDGTAGLAAYCQRRLEQALPAR